MKNTERTQNNQNCVFEVVFVRLFLLFNRLRAFRQAMVFREVVRGVVCLFGYSVVWRCGYWVIGHSFLYVFVCAVT